MRRLAAVTAAKDDAILDLLSAGQAGSEVVARRVKLPPRTAQYRLRQLTIRGLVIGTEPRGVYRLSPAGHAHVLRRRLPASRSPRAEPDVLEQLPEAHQSFLRLLTDAVVARRTLGRVLLSNWPGFILFGPSKTGKTLLGQLLCRRFGFAPAAYNLVLPRETPGSLWGRRVNDAEKGWRFNPAALLARAFVVLDEYDKAPKEVQRAAQAYLQGDSYFKTDEERAWVSAVPLVVLNMDRGTERLPEPYVRRSVVLNTAPLLEATKDIDEVARVLLRAKLPRVPVDVAPPDRELPEETRALLRAALRAALTDQGWRRVDVESIARLALGRWAIDKDGGPDHAALAVAADYLLCTSTCDGEVTEDWSSRLDAVATTVPEQGAAAGIAAAGARGQSERERREFERRDREALEAATAGKREELLARLKHALAGAPRSLTTDEQTRLAHARGRASYWRTKVKQAESLEELARLEELVRSEVLEPHEAIARSHDAATSAAARGKDIAARQKAAERERKAQVTAYLARLQELYRRDDATYDPRLIDELIQLRCLRAESYQYREETLTSKARHLARGVKEQVARLIAPPARDPAPDPIIALLQIPYYPGPGLAPIPPPEGQDREYVLKTQTEYVDADGRRCTEYELRSWSSRAVRAALRAAAQKWGHTLKEPRRKRATTLRPRVMTTRARARATR